MATHACYGELCMSRLHIFRRGTRSQQVNHAAHTHAQVVASKFEYVVTCQIYGKLSSAKPGSADKWKGDGIDELRKQFSRNLRVGYVDTQADGQVFSCLLGIDPISGADRTLFKVNKPSP